ncbi:MAG: hypothetical protein KOO61_05770 [Spirochaetales bacterium]|nr:hypothetical protein [Spirochaetales bacterium]
MFGLSIVMSFPPLQNPGDDFPVGRLMTAVLEAISSRPFYDACPITWNAPTAQLMDRANVTAAEITAKLGRRDSDLFIPMGLTGVPHHFLLCKESISEIEWAVSNLWRTGCTDAGFERPPFILLSGENREPPLNDGNLPLAFLARLDGLPIFATADGTRYRCLPMIDSSTLDINSVRTGSRSVARAARRIGRSLRGEKMPAEAAVLAVVTTQEDVDRIPNLLDGLQEFCRRDAAEVRSLPDLCSWRSVPGPVAPFGRTSAPDTNVYAAAAQMRKRRASRINRRRTLELIVGADQSGTDQNPPSPRSPGGRDFVASMMGDVALAGPSSGLSSGFSSDALFRGGRFCGFSADHVSWFPPAVSYLWSPDESDRLPRFEPTTCFSFESDESRGVRVVERSGPTQLVSDFSFVRERPLLVSTHALFVDGDNSPLNSELLHLALPAGRHGTIRVRAGNRDGWSQETDLGESDHVQELFGSRFRIRLGEEILAIAFLTRSGLPLVSSVGIFRVPELMLAVGGRFSVAPTGWSRATTEFAMLMGAGSAAVEEIDRLLSSRLSAALQRELGNGP